jgi:hypothetical protein
LRHLLHHCCKISEYFRGWTSQPKVPSSGTRLDQNTCSQYAHKESAALAQNSAGEKVVGSYRVSVASGQYIFLYSSGVNKPLWQAYYHLKPTVLVYPKKLNYQYLRADYLSSASRMILHPYPSHKADRQAKSSVRVLAPRYHQKRQYSLQKMFLVHSGKLDVK